MRSLLQCLALCAAVSFCGCYDSHESTESFEDLFVPRNRANSFITPQRRNVFVPPRSIGINQFNVWRPRKSPAEMQAETCEDFSPCRLYAYRFGYQQAYRRYFGLGGRNRLPQSYRPAGSRGF
uniref:Matrix Gla protein n=1 Tax=Oryzias sinensis TaxID=183150 RepID=A0A8C7YZ07_9TELE